ncbi:spermatogenesis-associated protein 24 isoform X2 [Lepisosteus oculatus]|uniref:spermatogenesis-associated protein 24 isoform X2 n=1 Tax=Lepisosteus oculatus TaxID=7918 RepID=UPI0035F524DD
MRGDGPGASRAGQVAMRGDGPGASRAGQVAMRGDGPGASRLVYDQMRDVIQTQQSVILGLREKMAVQGKSMVPKEKYEEVALELESERQWRVRTQELLARESEKLDFALGEIEVLSKNLQREKESFEKALASMKNRALKESAKNEKMKSKCSHFESSVLMHQAILKAKDDQIRELQRKLEKQKNTFKVQLRDLEIQKQQEAYIARELLKKSRSRTRHPQPCPT